MVRSRDWAILSFLVHSVVGEEETEQTSGKQQKQKQNGKGADRFLALFCMFPN